MRITVVGGGYAGITCALRLARKAQGRAEITLVNASDRFVERIRLHQQAAGARAPEHDLRRILRRSGVRLEIGQVRRIDPAAHTLELGDRRIEWDKLVLALGSRTEVDTVPGVRSHAFTLDAGNVAGFTARIREVASHSGRVVVVGGGLSGVEAAAELVDAFPTLDVTLLTHRPVGDGWSERGRGHLVSTLGRLGVKVREGVRVNAVRATGVETEDETIPADAVLWTVGFVAPILAREAGLAVNARGQVLVDAALRSISHPDIYAAGDVASPVQPPGHQLPMGCKSAGPAGAHVADNLAGVLHGLREQPFDFRTPFYCVSLGRRDGLIQFPRPDGALTGDVLTGRRAAWFKELICRGTVWALHMERVGFIGTKWMKTGHPPHLEGQPRRELAA